MEPCKSFKRRRCTISWKILKFCAECKQHTYNWNLALFLRGEIAKEKGSLRAGHAEINLSPPPTRPARAFTRLSGAEGTPADGAEDVQARGGSFSAQTQHGGRGSLSRVPDPVTESAQKEAPRGRSFPAVSQRALVHR